MILARSKTFSWSVEGELESREREDLDGAQLGPARRRRVGNGRPVAAGLDIPAHRRLHAEPLHREDSHKRSREGGRPVPPPALHLKKKKFLWLAPFPVLDSPRGSLVGTKKEKNKNIKNKK